jgi:hypothetical protein
MKSVANGKVLPFTTFRELFVQPATQAVRSAPLYARIATAPALCLVSRCKVPHLDQFTIRSR